MRINPQTKSAFYGTAGHPRRPNKQMPKVADAKLNNYFCGASGDRRNRR